MLLILQQPIKNQINQKSAKTMSLAARGEKKKSMITDNYGQ